MQKSEVILLQPVRGSRQETVTFTAVAESPREIPIHLPRDRFGFLRHYSAFLVFANTQPLTNLCMFLHPTSRGCLSKIQWIKKGLHIQAWSVNPRTVHEHCKSNTIDFINVDLFYV